MAHAPIIDHAVEMVLEAVSELPLGAALLALQRASDLLNALQVATEQGKQLSELIDPNVIEATPHIAPVLAALLEAEPDYLAGAAVAAVAVKTRLLEMPAPFIV